MRRNCVHAVRSILLAALLMDGSSARGLAESAEGESLVSILSRHADLVIVVAAVFFLLVCVLGVLLHDNRRHRHMIRTVQEKDTLLDGIITSVPGGIALCRIGDRIECDFFNDSFLRMTGRSRAELEAWNGRGELFDHLIAPEYRDYFYREFADAAHRRVPINISFRYLPVSGESQDVHLTATPIPSSDDSIPLFCAVFTPAPDDYSACQQILDESEYGIYITDIDTYELLYVSRTLLQQLPGENRDYRGCKCYRYLRGLDSPCPDCCMAETTTTAFLVREHKNVQIGRSFLLRGKRINWKGTQARIEYVIDDTARIEAEAQKRELLDHLPAGIGILKVAGDEVQPIYLNDGYYAMLNLSRSEAGEDTLVARVHSEDLPRLQQAFSAAQTPGSHVDLRLRVRDGQQRFIYLRLEAIAIDRDRDCVTFNCCFSDVDTETRAQNAQAEAQEALSAAIEHSTMLYWDYDLQDDTVRLGEKAQRRLKKDAVQSGAPAYWVKAGLILPEYEEALAQSLVALKGGKAHVSTDVQVHMPDTSEIRWQRLQHTLIAYREGKPIRAIGTAYDVTEEKLSHERYAEARAYRALLNTDTLAAVRLNLSRNIVLDDEQRRTASAPVEFMTLDDVDSLLAAQLAVLLPMNPGRDMEAFFNREAMLAAYRDGSQHIHADYLYSGDGTAPRWFRITVDMIKNPDSGDIEAYAYLTDVHVQKIKSLASARLLDSDVEYAVCVSLATGDGYSVRRAKESAFVQTDDPMRFEAMMADYVEENVAVNNQTDCRCAFTLPYALQQLQNAPVFRFDYETQKTPVRRKQVRVFYLDERKTMLVYVVTDITEVYQRDREQQRRLEHALEDARTANAAKSEFLSRMSHDIRTPMNAIIGMTALAKEDLHDAEALDQYLTKIGSAGDFLLGLVNDCLDLEKIEERRMELHPQRYSYAEFLSSLRTMFAPLCMQKHIRFIIDKGTTDVAIFVDKVRFEQIFFNLLSNAIKFTPPGGRVEYAVSNNQIEDGILRCDFLIRDNGIGMSKEFQKKLFTPFAQESNEILPQSQGTGLGLVIVKNIVELMGGTIRIESEEGVGTAVYVHLAMPLAGKNPTIDAQSQGEQDAVLAGKRVLLVEDHPLNAEIARKLLEKKQMEVVLCPNGQLGVDTFAESAPNQFQLILMDIRMPVLNGLEATRKIRALARPDAQRIPIIAMTANAYDEDVRKSHEAGMNAHLGKPIRPEELYRMMAMFLKK